MASYYINSYKPLVATKAGREARANYHLPPFIDGSIRREPDLQHDFPAITCLCRAGRFTPRLRIDDVVAYVTKVGRFGTSEKRHQRLTAVLQVIEIFESHLAAASWYTNQGMPLPNNCMVRGNAANPLERSHRSFKGSKCVGDAQTHRNWDMGYRKRARKHGSFVVCKKLWHNLCDDAPRFSTEDLVDDFGYAPGTQNPGSLDVQSFNKFMRRLHVPVPPSVP